MYCVVFWIRKILREFINTYFHCTWTCIVHTWYTRIHRELFIHPRPHFDWNVEFRTKIEQREKKPHITLSAGTRYTPTAQACICMCSWNCRYVSKQRMYRYKCIRECNNNSSVSNFKSNFKITKNRWKISNGSWMLRAICVSWNTIEFSFYARMVE